MAEAAISSLLNLLGDLLIQKVKFVRGVKGEVESLKDELRRMLCFLEDANRKQIEDASVRNWISEIREVALDAEYIIQMFLLNVESASNRGSLKTCTTFPEHMLHLDRIGDEIESIRRRLKDIGGKDKHLVGIKDDVKKLLQESILNREKGLSTVVLRGMGGIGKSTLAREIYNHPNIVDGPFDCRVWVVVSSEFRERETMKQLISELPNMDYKKLHDLEQSTKDEQYILRKLQEMLHEQLRGKNYFIVLDDVWKKEQWEYLRSAFPDEEDKVSRLLVTSRNKIIQDYNQYEHEMKVLDFEKSWELLLKKASINGTCPEELASIGRQIVGKCCGIPLAISVVGGLLMATQTKSGWERILNQINSYLVGEKSYVSPILELSYQNLSPQLKPCFLCLAIFKEDSTIPSKRLVDIWDAQGLIKPEGSCTIDEIGRGYLNELINRSMLQIEDLTFDDQVENCRLHDLLRDMCLSKAKEEMGLRNVSASSPDESSRKTRHLVVDVKSDLITSSQEQNKHLHSLFLLNASEVHVRISSRYWKSFQLLKTLDLNGFSLQKLPRSFRFLLGLKYLRIISPKVLQLPSWFDHLKKLEVCIVDSVRFSYVPLKMESLRQFRAISIHGKAMRIWYWKNIQTLDGIRPQDLLEIISTVTASSHLRELGIRIIESEGADAVSRVIASLGKMTNLVKLCIYCSYRIRSFTELKLDASVFPPNLSYLMLVGKLDEPLMEELGKPPNLMYLKLVNIGEEIGTDWRMKVSHDGFPCLEALSLNRMYHLRGMDIKEGGMPRLKRLQIYECPNLGTENLPERIIISSTQ